MSASQMDTSSELKQSDVRRLHVEQTDVEDFEFEHCVCLFWGIKCSLQSFNLTL